MFKQEEQQKKKSLMSLGLLLLLAVAAAFCCYVITYVIPGNRVILLFLLGNPFLWISISTGFVPEVCKLCKVYIYILESQPVGPPPHG